MACALEKETGLCPDVVVISKTSTRPSLASILLAARYVLVGINRPKCCIQLHPLPLRPRGVMLNHHVWVCGRVSLLYRRQVKLLVFLKLAVLLVMCATIVADSMTDGLVECLWSICQDL